MQSKLHLSTNLNAVNVAEPKAGSESAKASASAAAPGSELCASQRIRDARQMLRELLLRDDFNFGNSRLLSTVSEALDRITLELDDLAGRQKLYELWIDTSTEE